METKIDIYPHKDGDWHWRLRHDKDIACVGTNAHDTPDEAEAEALNIICPPYEIDGNPIRLTEPPYGPSNPVPPSICEAKHKALDTRFDVIEKNLERVLDNQQEVLKTLGRSSVVMEALKWASCAVATFIATRIFGK